MEFSQVVQTLVPEVLKSEITSLKQEIERLEKQKDEAARDHAKALLGVYLLHNNTIKGLTPNADERLQSLQSTVGSHKNKYDAAQADLGKANTKLIVLEQLSKMAAAGDFPMLT